MTIRQLHMYLGVFFAPAIVFFAFSGALQTFGLHENRGGGDYRPPAWIVTLAQVHKDQSLERPHGHGGGPSAGPDSHDHQAGHETHKPDGPGEDAGRRSHGDEGPSPSALPLKCFVLALALGLIATASLGVFLAVKNFRTRRGALIVLAAGIVAPIVLLYL